MADLVTTLRRMLGLVHASGTVAHDEEHEDIERQLDDHEDRIRDLARVARADARIDAQRAARK